MRVKLYDEIHTIVFIEENFAENLERTYYLTTKDIKIDEYITDKTAQIKIYGKKLSSKDFKIVLKTLKDFHTLSWNKNYTYDGHYFIDENWKLILKFISGEDFISEGSIEKPENFEIVKEVIKDNSTY